MPPPPQNVPTDVEKANHQDVLESKGKICVVLQDFLTVILQELDATVTEKMRDVCLNNQL